MAYRIKCTFRQTIDSNEERYHASNTRCLVLAGIKLVANVIAIQLIGVYPLLVFRQFDLIWVVLISPTQFVFKSKSICSNTHFFVMISDIYPIAVTSCDSSNGSAPRESAVFLIYIHITRTAHKSWCLQIKGICIR